MADPSIVDVIYRGMNATAHLTRQVNLTVVDGIHAFFIVYSASRAMDKEVEHAISVDKNYQKRDGVVPVILSAVFGRRSTPAWVGLDMGRHRPGMDNDPD
jgi:hypothetical protein